MATAKELIYKIQLHENLKYWVMHELAQAGIECQEQNFNEKRGDILVVKVEDVPKALDVIQRIKDKVEQRQT
ncbi:MAG: hypothetical protein AAGG51_28175 [Cyanobacteria bacterium P01_G01_bin.54]